MHHAGGVNGLCGCTTSDAAPKPALCPGPTRANRARRKGAALRPRPRPPQPQARPQLARPARAARRGCRRGPASSTPLPPTPPQPGGAMVARAVLKPHRGIRASRSLIALCLQYIRMQASILERHRRHRAYQQLPRCGAFPRSRSKSWPSSAYSTHCSLSIYLPAEALLLLAGSPHGVSAGGRHHTSNINGTPVGCWRSRSSRRCRTACFWRAQPQRAVHPAHRPGNSVLVRTVGKPRRILGQRSP